VLLINLCDTPMDIPDAICGCDISYPTVDTVCIVFFFKNYMRVAITFTHDNNAMYIVSTQWTDIEPAGARVRAPDRDQNVMIENLKIVDAPGNPLLFTGHIDVLRRYLSESFECTRTPAAMLIESSCSPPYESAGDSARESADKDGVLVLDTDESDSDTNSDNMVPDTDTDESGDDSDSDTNSDNMVPDTDTDNDEFLYLD
jgi:hypothetical protein